MPYKEKPIKQVRDSRAKTIRKRQLGFDSSDRKTQKQDQVDLLGLVCLIDTSTLIKNYCTYANLNEKEMSDKFNYYLEIYKRDPERRFRKG